MFDPKTRELIQGVQAIGEINPDTLPEYLARAFDLIVEFRVARETSQFRNPETLQATTQFLRSLGNSLETLVVLRPEGANRRSSAFVAAQAKRLLSSYEKAWKGEIGKRPFLHADYVDSEISGMLLFLIAEQQSDALDVAREVEEFRVEEDNVASVLTGALVNLVKGRLIPIADLPLPNVDSKVLRRSAGG